MILHELTSLQLTGPQMPEMIHDPELGTLHAIEFAWQRDWPDSQAGPATELIVEIDERALLEGRMPPPTQPQRDAFLAYRAAEKAWLEAAQEAIFELYQTIRPNIIEHAFWLSPEDKLELVPDLANSKEIWKLLGGLAVYIPAQEGPARRVRLACNCTWDPEHGIAVLLEEGRFLEFS